MLLNFDDSDMTYYSANQELKLYGLARLRSLGRLKITTNLVSYLERLLAYTF